MNELLIHLDSKAGTALYEQIYEHIRQDITDGRLSRGERLPSARMLAAQLQISRSTVDTAYAQLVSEGYLEARRGSGYYVCDSGQLYHLTTEERRDTPATGSDYRTSGGRKYVTQNGCDRDSGQGQRPSALYQFRPGQIDSAGFSYRSWRRAGKEAMLELEHDLLQPGHPQGEYRLRRAIASYLYQARGVHCGPSQLIVGAGNEYLLLLLGQILGTGQKVAMESPTYLQAYYTFRNIGYEVTAVPADTDGMKVEEIPDAGVSLAYVMPSHQFPLGCIMPLKRRLQLLAWAEALADRYIIEDDHDSEFRYKGKPVPALHSMDGRGKVIYLGTFSNSIMPSIRVSYLVLPEELLCRYHSRCGFYASTVSRVQQMTVCRFIENGSFGRHLNKMRRIYKAKHDVLLQLLKGRDWVGRIYGAHAGLHIAVEIKGRVPEKEVIAQAAALGLDLQGMEDCCLADSRGPDRRPVLLLGFGGLTQEQIRKGMELLDQCVRRSMESGMEGKEAEPEKQDRIMESGIERHGREKYT